MLEDRDSEFADIAAPGMPAFERCNPVSGKAVSRATAGTAREARAAAEKAQSAFPAWSETGPTERRRLLLAAADLLESRAADFVRIGCAETGGTPGWMGFNVHLAAGMLREAASMTTQIGGEVIPSDKPGNISMAIRQPVGVVLGIAPWNAPIILGVRALALPLACGNCAILKASEICPATHTLIVDVLREAGLPDGVINVVTNAPGAASPVVEALIAHPAIRRINFTGSTKVGRIIAELGAKYLKPVLLELGGKAPLIVLRDADLEEAAKAATFGAFMNQGQICMSTERIIVDEAVADDFARILSAKAAALPAGDPAKGKVVLGSLVSHEAGDRVQTLIEDAVSKGAKVLSGNSRTQSIMTATVLDSVTSNMRLYSEESFGPVVCIIRVKDDEEAIRVANESEYGLSSAVFSKDIARALKVAKRIEAGICHINGPTVHDEAQMPFGGVKASGFGRFGGKAGIAEFTDLRWISIETGPQHYPF